MGRVRMTQGHRQATVGSRRGAGLKAPVRSPEAVPRRGKMEIFAGLSVLFLVLTALVIAIKTFALWRRTRGAPELLLGLYLTRTVYFRPPENVGVIGIYAYCCRCTVGASDHPGSLVEVLRWANDPSLRRARR